MCFHAIEVRKTPSPFAQRGPPCSGLASHGPQTGPWGTQSPAPNCESFSCRKLGADGGLLLWLTLAWMPRQQPHQALVLEWNSRNQAATPLDPTFVVSNTELSRRKGKKKKSRDGEWREQPKPDVLSSWHRCFSQDADERKLCGLTDPHQPPSSCEQRIQISPAGFNHLLPLNNKLGAGQEKDLFMSLTVKKMFTVLK